MTFLTKQAPKLPQLHRLGDDSNKNHGIWEEIVHFANADMSADTVAGQSLLKVVQGLIPMPEFTEFKLNDGFLVLSELSGSRKNDLALLAARYQKPLKTLLTWLCKPKSHPELREEALRFLESESLGEHWHIEFDEDPIESVDFDEEKEIPFLYFIKKVEYQSIANPICKFIFSYVDDPPRALPIRICRREACGRFFVPKRKSKQYCSDSCRAQVHQKETTEQTDYMYVHRLEKLGDIQLLRIKLKERHTQERLAGISERWPDWGPRKIKHLKSLLTKSKSRTPKARS